MLRTKLAIMFFVVSLLALPLAAQQQQSNPPPPPPPPASTAQEAQQTAPPPMAPEDLDRLVNRIALYPDPLLAQVLTGSTYWDEIPDAANWADEHSGLKGDALAQAIKDDNLQWDPSVLALLPFPSVLDMMARDPDWTQQLGEAVLNQRPDVMDAVQRMRKEAYDYGYLRTSPYDTVTMDDGYCEILPVNPAYLYVPVYDPGVVFFAPRPGFFIGGAIGFGPAVIITGAFAPWGWAHPYFLWRSHGIFFDNGPWGRTWMNRGFYRHSYARPWVRSAGPRIERHSFSRPRGRP